MPATPDTDPQDGVAQFGDTRSGLGARAMHLVYTMPAVVPLLVLLLAVAIFGVLLGDRFFSPFALTLVLQQVAIIGIIAMAQSIVILTAGIDLSVGAVMILSSVVMGKFATDLALPQELAVLCGLLCGLGCGLASGYLVAVWKLPPFIVTLGMWQIVLAANFLYSGSEVIRSQTLAAEAPLLQFFGRTVEVGGANFTYGVIFMLLLVAGMSYALSQTAWGRHVYAVGDDAQAAELSGVNVRRTQITVYGLGGLICAFAGWVLIGRSGSVSPQAGQFANIESITAVVIGGISLFGGRGAVAGALFGALIVGVFTLGLRLLGLDVQWTYLLIGLLIILAVTVDQRIRKASL